MKQKNINTLRRLGLTVAGLGLAVGILVTGALSVSAHAASVPNIFAQAPPPEQQPQGEEKTEPVKIERSKDDEECRGGDESCKNKMFEYVNYGIAVLSAMAGVIFVIMVVWGGIEYSSAGGDAQRVAAAKSKVTNAIIGLIAFGLLYGFLSWIVPGGIG